MSRGAWLAVLAAAAGCATYRAEPAIPERRLPDAFPGEGGGPSAGQAPWREWMQDEQLRGLVAEAVGNNQDLLVAVQRIEMARAGVQAATGVPLPRVGVGAGAGIQKFGRYTADGAGNASTEITPGRFVPVHLGNFALGLQASWELDVWGRLRAQREAAAAQYLASVEGTSLVLTAPVADVAAAYYELLALDHAREVLRQAVASQERAVEIVRLQKEAGRANELAVQQFEAQLAETRTLERDSSQRAVEAEHRIHVLVGRYPRPVARRKEALFVEDGARVAAGVPSDLLRNRPDVRRAELQVRAARYDLRAARAAFFPSLSITAGAGLQAFNPVYLLRVPESVTYSLAGGLLAPLVNRRALEAQFAHATAAQIQAMYEYQKAVLVAYVEVVNALSGIRHLEEVLALKKAQKEAVARTVETADILYRAGKASYLEVLMAQQSALRAELDLVDAWKRRRLSRVAVYGALGGGWR